jgi:hypothetical protein
MLGKVGTIIGGIGAGIVALYTGGSWIGNQVVWAAQFNQTVADFNCQFSRITRTQLEGQAADTDYRISTYQQKKVLTPDEARDLSTFHVRKDAIQRQLNSLGADCGQQQQRQSR